MKNHIIIILLCSCFFLSACEDTDLGLATDAGLDAIKAVTLSDEDVKQIAVRASRESDQKHRVAPAGNPYAQRLQRLVGKHYREGDFEFNYKVYLSPQVNAFAMADGTIRIYSGLMDMMDDGELLFVVGHEMGHVVGKHIKKKIMLAYAGSAVRKGIASQQNEAGEIARSALGGLLEQLLNAQFSQQEEREADDYGLTFLQKGNYQENSAVSALNKLATLGNDHSFLSSHPAPKARAKRLQERLDDPTQGDEPSLLSRIWGWVRKLTDLVSGLFG